MPSRVYERTFEIQAPPVEPVAFSDDPATRTAYPLTRLRLAGPPEPVKLQTLVLENEHARSFIVPAFGGRVLQQEPTKIAPAEGGRRGLFLELGSSLSLDAEGDSLAPVDFLLHEPEDGSAAAVMTFSSTAGSRLSLQAVYSLPENSSDLLVEARVFNRSLDPQPIDLTASGRSLAKGSLGARDTVAVRFKLGEIPAFEPLSISVSGQPKSHDPDSLPREHRGPAHVLAAVNMEHRAALDHIDAALGTLSEDPLTWWHRSVLARHLGEDDESPTMAHALSPLEPVLRAEAFLRTPQSQGKEPSTVLKPLIKDADALHECVHLYIEMGFFQDASRLIDEIQRHGEQPLLRYMLAWILMKHTRMELEASSEVQKASIHPIAPPFPWRPLERAAVDDLASRFKSDARLQTLAKLCGPATL